MLPVSWGTVRLFLHVLAATVWVGGQLTLAALVPALRRFGAEVPRAAARRFNQVAWIAFAVLIVTGIWNVAAAWSEISHSAGYRDTLIVKLVVVSISGITAALHARGGSAVSLAVFGALTGVSALAALFLGVLLAGGARCCGCCAEGGRGTTSGQRGGLGVSVMSRWLSRWLTPLVLRKRVRPNGGRAGPETRRPPPPRRRRRPRA